MKQKEIATEKTRILQLQNFKCPICLRNLKLEQPRNLCLDHDHTSGLVRMVLCRNCNGLEGEIFNRARRGARGNPPEWFLHRILKYWEHTENDLWGLYHPNHKTADEKRERINKRARVARARKKAKENLKG